MASDRSVPSDSHPNVRSARDESTASEQARVLDDARRWLTDALATGKVSRVKPNSARSNDLLIQTQRHVVSARSLADSDPTLALAACHDAVRKAIDADAGANGLRFENIAGSHRTTLDSAATQLEGAVADDDLRDADRLRQRRHGAEYGELPAGSVNAEEIESFARMADRVVKVIISRRMGTASMR